MSMPVFGWKHDLRVWLVTLLIPVAAMLLVLLILSASGVRELHVGPPFMGAVDEADDKEAQVQRFNQQDPRTRETLTSPREPEASSPRRIDLAKLRFALERSLGKLSAAENSDAAEAPDAAEVTAHAEQISQIYDGNQVVEEELAGAVAETGVDLGERIEDGIDVPYLDFALLSADKVHQMLLDQQLIAVGEFDRFGEFRRVVGRISGSGQLGFERLERLDVFNLSSRSVQPEYLYERHASWRSLVVKRFGFVADLEFRLHLAADLDRRISRAQIADAERTHPGVPLTELRSRVALERRAGNWTIAGIETTRI